jgi:hypothetical protein
MITYGKYSNALGLVAYRGMPDIDQTHPPHTTTDLPMLMTRTIPFTDLNMFYVIQGLSDIN